MIVAVTTAGPGLESAVDQRFGRAPFLLIVDTGTMSCDARPNHLAAETGGVGTRLAGMLARANVEMVLTGTVGPHARQALDQAGIQTASCGTGSAREAITAMLRQPSPATTPGLDHGELP